MVNKMAEPSSGKDGKEVTRSNSFTKFIRSPGRSNSMKKSNSLTKLLFGRKGSSKKGEGSTTTRDEAVESEPTENENAASLLEDVKEVFESTIDNVSSLSVEQTIIAPRSTESLDNSFSEAKKSQHDLVENVKGELDHVASETKEIKHSLLGKFKEGFGKAKEGLKEEYSKAKEEVKSVVHKDKKSHEEQHHHHDHPLADDKKPSVDIKTTNDEKKPVVVVEEVKAPNLAQRLHEEVVAVVSTIDAAKKSETTTHDQEEGKEKEGEVKKEENCVSSLAQGLEKLCSPWSTKKEE